MEPSKYNIVYKSNSTDIALAAFGRLMNIDGVTQKGFNAVVLYSGKRGTGWELNHDLIIRVNFSHITMNCWPSCKDFFDERYNFSIFLDMHLFPRPVPVKFK
jgi:hypothetical protein